MLGLHEGEGAATQTDSKVVAPPDGSTRA
jgi:hypothetical protein